MSIPSDSRGNFGGWELVGLSWAIFSINFTPLFLAHILCFIVLVAGHLVLLPIFLMGSVWFGFSLMSLNAIRGNEVNLMQIFSGFGRYFYSTFMVTVYTMLIFLCSSVFICMLWLFIISIFYFENPEILSNFSLNTLALEVLIFILFALMLLFFLLLLPAVVLVVLYAPCFFILVDNPEMDAWVAMEKSRKMVMGNWARWGKLWAALSVIHLLGILACCVGYFIVTPWMVVALAMAYERSRDIEIQADEIPAQIL